MSLTEWLLLAQACILFLTAGVVAWYTWETSRIRKLTDIQTTLSSEFQLKKLGSNEAKSDVPNNLSKLSFIDLAFVDFPVKSSINDSGGEWTFTNKGGPVTNLHVTAVGNVHRVSIAPIKLRMYDQLSLQIADVPKSDDKLFSVQFEIHYTNKLGFNATQGYRYYPNFDHKFEHVYTLY